MILNSSLDDLVILSYSPWVMRGQGQDRVELLGLGAKDWISKMQNSDSGSEYELLVKEVTNTFCLITNTESVSSVD